MTMRTLLALLVALFMIIGAVGFRVLSPAIGVAHAQLPRPAFRCCTPVGVCGLPGAAFPGSACVCSFPQGRVGGSACY